MKYYAKGKEITEKEFDELNERNIQLFAEYERSGDMALLLDMVFLTQIPENFV